jgi:predicted transposase/invertase (TIGR01784 family)
MAQYRLKEKYELSPIADENFAHIFGDQRNIEVLKAFLASVLDIPAEDYDDLTLLNPVLKRRWKKDKLAVVDVLVRTRSGRLVHVEVQVQHSPVMRSRILFYLTKLLWEQMKRGFGYDRLRQVVSIVICDHVLLPEEEGYLNEYAFLNGKSGGTFTDLLKVITLELPKLPEEGDGREVWAWCRFFGSRSGEELERAAEAEGVRGIEMAIKLLKEFSWGERRRMMADERQKRRWDLAMYTNDARNEGLAQGRNEGLAQGRNEGREQGKLDVARRLKVRGLPLEVIVEDTGLPLETVKSL